MGGQLARLDLAGSDRCRGGMVCGEGDLGGTYENTTPSGKLSPGLRVVMVGVKYVGVAVGRWYRMSGRGGHGDTLSRQSSVERRGNVSGAVKVLHIVGTIFFS